MCLSTVDPSLKCPKNGKGWKIFFCSMKQTILVLSLLICGCDPIKPSSETIGYGIPYATQYTNPQKIADSYSQGGFAVLPQADPNGLFSPSAAEGTWILMKDPHGDKVCPVYV